MINTAAIYPTPRPRHADPRRCGPGRCSINVTGNYVLAEEAAASPEGAETARQPWCCTSSANAVVPKSGSEAYDVSKAAVNHLIRELAIGLGPLVRVNGIAPATVIAGSSMFPRDRVIVAAAEVQHRLRGGRSRPRRCGPSWPSSTRSARSPAVRSCRRTAPTRSAGWPAMPSAKTTGHVIPVDGGLAGGVSPDRVTASGWVHHADLALHLPATTTRCFPKPARRWSPCSSGSGIRSSSARRRPAAARCTTTPATQPRRCRLMRAVSSTIFDGAEVICVPSASCVAMIRDHYPKMAAESGRSGARRPKSTTLLARVFEFTELLIDKLGVTDVGALVSAHGHASHFLPLAALAASRRSTACDCSQAVRGLELVALPGHGSVLRLRRHVRGQERRRLDARWPADKARCVLETGAEVCTAADNSCLMQIGGTLSAAGAPGRALPASRGDTRAPLSRRMRRDDPRRRRGRRRLPSRRRRRTALANPQLRRNVRHATDVIRAKRALVVGEMPDWEAAARSRPHEIKEHTLRHLDFYLEQFEEQLHPRRRAGPLGARRRRGEPDHRRHHPGRAASRRSSRSRR